MNQSFVGFGLSIDHHVTCERIWDSTAVIVVGQYCEGEVTSISSSCEKAPVYSLDDYMREQQQQGNSNSNSNNSNSNSNNNVRPNIDMLLIDAEGYDYEVLQGACETLKRVTYLLFEVHIVGNWMNHSLSETIDTILQDFTCYWAENSQLW
jgi:hypothetical protein